MNTRALSPYRNQVSNIDQLMHHFFSPVTWTEAKPEVRIPRMDILESDTGFEIKADLPGVSNDAITVSVKDNVLTIEAQAETSEDIGNEVTSEPAAPRSGFKVVTRERGHGKYKRALRLGSSIDESAIKAVFANGVLTLELPKVAKPEAKRIPVMAH